MNPLTLLSPTRWLLLACCVAALVWGYFAWADHQQDIGYDKAKAEYLAVALKAEQVARAKETSMQYQLQRAQDDAKKREAKLAADAGNLRRERDGLRGELSASRSQLSGASCASVRERAAALTDVFDQCAGAFEDLAGKADRHAIDSLMYQQGWPR